MRSWVQKFIYCLCLLSLSGCGFHLRGAVSLAPRLHELYVQAEDPYSPLVRYLKQSLQLSGVHLTATVEDASTHLVISNEQTRQQLLGVSGSQQTRLYNLILTVSFQVTDPSGKVLVPTQSLSESRTMTMQVNQILGGSNEETNLYQQMRRNIIFTIMNRLSSPEVTANLTR